MYNGVCEDDVMYIEFWWEGGVGLQQLKRERESGGVRDRSSIDSQLLLKNAKNAG